MDSIAATVGLGALALLAVLADVIRAHHAGFGRFINRVFGPLMRAAELGSPGEGVRFNGATLLLVSAAAATVAFGVRAAAYGVLLFLVADAAAGLLGRRFGKRTWVRGGATIVGTAAFIIAGLCVAFFLPGLSNMQRAAAVLVAAVVEAISPIDDNLTVPLAASATLFVLYGTVH